MFKNYHMVVLETDENIDSYIRIAANNHLHVLHKIGIYGKERQHELYVIGKSKNYRKFLRATERLKS